VTRLALLALFALACRAGTITIIEPVSPGEYILQFTADDWSTEELGPNFYCCAPGSWTADGETLPVLESYETAGWIRAFAFLACPASLPCNLTDTMPDAPAPPSGSGSPEPASWALMALALCVIPRERLDALRAWFRRN
jgi:hypothetical protein